MKSYRLYHRVLKLFEEVEAESALEACQAVGWYMAATWIRELTPRVPDPSSESGYKGGGWKNVTPRDIR